MPYQFGTDGFYQPNEPPHTPIRDNTPRSPKAWVSEDTSDDEGEQQPGPNHQFIPREALPAEFNSSNNHEVPPASIGVSGLHSSQQYPGIDTASVHSSGRAYATVIGGTPYRKNPPPRTHPSKQSVKDHATLLMQAQGDVANSVEGYYLNQFGVVPGLSTAEIMPWLSQEANQPIGAFINGHWNVPQDPPKENLLYEPFEDVLNSILEKFVKPHCGPGASRRVIDTHGAKVRHGDGHFTSPDLLVRATGASFDAPLTNFGYGDVATFFELKLDGQLDEPIHIHQMVVYARQVYAHQPNRKFVRGLLLSDKRARLVHYDHSGVQVSPPININERPPLFVRIVVGLCNGDESFIGFDDSIQWEHDICNRKISGTLTAKFDKDSVPKRYHLRSIRPIANIIDIRGRATTCWAVRDNETGEDLIVKDSWDSGDRPPEYLHLIKVKGAQGVCEIVWHSSDKHPRFETRLFRCAKGTRAGVHYYNRVASRIIMKAYGKQIHHFKSILELLHALRDAIAGHSNVFGKEIVHRDISNMNVLLGREDAEVGNRGILIDLGVAIDFEEEDSVISDEARTGSRFFQSCEILDYLTDLAEGEDPPPHDYLDDLEAFFNLVSFCFFKYKPDGTDRSQTDKARLIVEGWDSEDPKVALDAKNMLFTPARRYRQKVLQLIGQSWGEACKTLFKEFLEWVWRIQEEKGRLVQEYIDAQEELERMKEQLKAQGIEPDPKVFEPAKESIFSPLFNQSDDHYVQVLKIFDKAIDSVVKSTPVPEPTRLINVFGLGASSGKRRRTQSIAPSRNGPPVKVVCISPEAPAS